MLKYLHFTNLICILKLKCLQANCIIFLGEKKKHLCEGKGRHEEAIALGLSNVTVFSCPVHPCSRGPCSVGPALGVREPAPQAQSSHLQPGPMKALGSCVSKQPEWETLSFSLLGITEHN